jgi:phospholipase C
MMDFALRSTMCALLGLAAACGSDGRQPGSCDGPCPASKVNHLIVLIQENHTFDNYFGRYCTAATGSAPTCTSGPACCEAGPDHEPSGAAPLLLDDDFNANRDPDHTQACELAEANGGLMDRYVTGATCSDPGNFAYGDATVMGPYWQLAAAGALADRYFQPLAGQSSANDMYFVRAQFVFNDNEFKPEAIGQECSLNTMAKTFEGPTIGDLLDGAGVSWALYAEGYQAMVDARATDGCPSAPEECSFRVGIYPCVYDVGDIPIDYYATHRDNPRVLRDFAQLAKDLSAGTLPQVVFVRGYGFHSEHPGYGTTISDGMKFTADLLASLKASAYAPDTLVLVTWDEGGGYFDHIAPPGLGTDGQPYGTRVPLLAIGPFARANAISHVTLEHSSIVRFIEWNWLAKLTGQLAGRDATVSNIGSLLDPAATGTAVPE